MKWIILIGNEDFTLDSLKKIDYDGSVSSYTVEEIGGRFCVDFGSEHIYFDFEENIDDFEEDINIVPFDKPSIIIVTYTSKECLRKLLRQDNFPSDIFIDNDFGLIVSLKDFVELGMPLDNEDMVYKIETSNNR